MRLLNILDEKEINNKKNNINFGYNFLVIKKTSPAGLGKVFLFKL